MSDALDFQPVVIIGAARSGTKMLREIIASGDGMRAVPYDVNYIWRYGNQHLSDDTLDPATATRRIVQFVRRQLLRCAGMSRFDSGNLVEKTVSNILRVPFVATVFPNARYVVLIRDGRDVVESAARCWQERPDFANLLEKCRTFPWLACASYGWNYATATMKRLMGTRSRPTWGPRYPGIDQHAATLSMLEVCAHQWRYCMEQYESQRNVIPDGRRLEIHYERLVNSPECEVDRIAQFLKISADQLQHHAAKSIYTANVGKHGRLTSQQQAAIEQIAGPTLSRWGYECKMPVTGQQITHIRHAA